MPARAAGPSGPVGRSPCGVSRRQQVFHAVTPGAGAPGRNRVDETVIVARRTVVRWLYCTSVSCSIVSRYSVKFLAKNEYRDTKKDRPEFMWDFHGWCSEISTCYFGLGRYLSTTFVRSTSYRYALAMIFIFVILYSFISYSFMSLIIKLGNIFYINKLVK